MFKKVKWTFIGIMMALLATVLVATLLIYNITSYNSQMDSIRSSLEYALDTGPEKMGIPNVGGRELYVMNELGSGLADEEAAGGDADTVKTSSGTSYAATETDDGVLVERLERWQTTVVEPGEGANPTGEEGAAGAVPVVAADDGTVKADNLNDGDSSADEAGQLPAVESEGVESQSPGGMRDDRPGYGNIDRSIPVYCVIVDTYWEIKIQSSNTYMDSSLLNAAIAGVRENVQDFDELTDLGLFYATRQDAFGTRIAFADSSVLHNRVAENILFSVLLGAGVLAVLFVISMLLAKLAMRPVEEAWAGQQRFIADASHELKTPLTVILANTDIIESQPPDSTIEEQSRWIEGIHEESVKMQGLVQDLLVLAQTEPDSEHLGSAPAQLVTVDLSSMVEKDILQFEAVAFESGVTIEDDVAEGLSVKADPDKLERVVRVLLDNACKYVKDIDDNPSDAPYRTDPVVRVTLGAERSQAVLKVNNGGRPIPQEDLPHVFDRFFRSDKARSDKTSGFGLGLPIARNIVTGIGGTIAVESGAEAGTTFTVKLPLAKE